MFVFEITGFRKLSRNDGAIAAVKLQEAFASSSLEREVVITLNGEDDATVSFLDELIWRTVQASSKSVKLVFEGFSKYTNCSVLPMISGKRKIDLWVKVGDKNILVEPKAARKMNVETVSFDELLEQFHATKD